MISLAMTGALTALVSAQTTESCYRANLDSFAPVTLSGSPDSLDLTFSSSTLLSGPDIGSISGAFQFDIFGGNGLTASYDAGSVLVDGYVAGNFSPLNVKLNGVKVDDWRVCSTDVKTWTMITDDGINGKVAEIEKAGFEVFYGNTETKDIQKLTFSDKESDGKGGFTYRIAGTDLDRLSDKSDLKFYSSSDGGRNFDFLGGTSDGSASVATEFYDFDICICTVPEPSSVSLLGLGGVAFLMRRRR